MNFHYEQGDFGEEVAKIVARKNNLGDDISDMFQVGRNGIDGAFLSKEPIPKLLLIESKASNCAKFGYSKIQKKGGPKYFDKMIKSHDERYKDIKKQLKKLMRENPGLKHEYIRVETDIEISQTGFGVDELKIKDWNKKIIDWNNNIF